ncbi:MAG: methyltransferase domain-containing protein [Thiobacillus sp.]|nr:methyltransferase domain-containing protein [Thiobacillus sp.]
MQTLSFRSLLKWIWQGKTLTRAMLNTRLAAEPELTGLVLDLGGGGEPTYKRLLKISGYFVNMDRIEEAMPTVVGDLESTYPFATDCADTAILFNTLEHVYDHQHVVSEMYRVLKPGGRALVYVPFIFPVHVHQTEKFLVDDYYRYTRSALDKMFTKAGFTKTDIEPMGGLFLAVAEFLGILVTWRLLRFPVFLFCMLLERLYGSLRPGVSAQRYPLAYFVVARK